ncbi:MAG: polysaccharide biosynthesis/export family protein [Bacteroidaceae bacterium]|nr:polysaccharide biosynthesis/export family protein [Bacteroidaceae bacterium]
MNIKTLFAVIIAALTLFGCATPKTITYVQDADSLRTVALAQASDLSVRKGDKLAIVVNCQDPNISAIFNLTISTAGSNQNNSNGMQLTCYTVDSNGEINFPVLGRVPVEGLTREQIAKRIQSRLLEEQLVKDPVVIVDFANLYFSVLGEVNSPGRYDIKNDRVTLLEAIGMAGDLTINGMRQNVLVLREDNGQQKVYRVDLTSGKDLYSSPVFYLQQKDVVYVEPNGYRKRQSTVNGNSMYTPTFWLSIASVVASLSLLIINACK